MADENLNNKALNPEEYRRVGEEAIGIMQSMADIAALINQNAKGLSQTTRDSADSFTTSFSKAKLLGKELASISKEDLKDRNFRKKLDSKVAAAQKEYIANERKRAQIVARAKIARGKEKQALEQLAVLYTQANISAKAQLNNTKQLYEELKRIDNDVKLWDDIADAVKDIPVLSKVFRDFAQAAKEAREASADGQATTTAILKNYGKAVGKAATALAAKTLWTGLKQGNQLTTDFARNLNTSTKEARELRDQVSQISISSGGLASAKDYADILFETSRTLGISARLSNSSLKTMGLMTKELGVSKEATQQLLKISETRGQGLEKESKQIVGQTMLLNERNKVNIRYQDVLEDIGKASSATLLTTQRFPGGIAKAAYEARKFGLNLAALEKSGESLLNFESSIEAELEAELLTGKELRLERARAAALTGDQATLAAELAKNFGTAEEFSSQNVLAQRAQAEAMGMTREELAETLLTQEAITKLGGDQSKSLEANYKARLKQVEAMAEGEEKTKAMAKLAEDVAGTEFKRQLDNKSAAEATQKAMQSMAEAAGQLSVVLEPVANLMTFIGKGAEGFLVAMTKVRHLVKGISGAFEPLLSVGKLLDKIKAFFGNADSAAKLTAQSAAEAGAKGGGGAIMKATGKKVTGAAASSAIKAGSAVAAKQGSKMGFKQIAKRIPILGSIVGAGFALNRFLSGDTTGGLMELGSAGLGLLDLLVPGLGTGLSIASDAAIAVRDVKYADEIQAKKQAYSDSKNSMNVNDFTIRTNPEDTLVMAGGTKFGDETNKLLKELIEVSNKRYDVYMNSMLVGHAVALDESRLG